MKRLLAILCLAASSLSAAGTVTYTLAPLGTSPVYVLSFSWTADASAATVPATAAAVLISNPQVQGMRVVLVETYPGSPAPTNLYSITLKDDNGLDELAAAGASIVSSSAAQGFAVAGASAPPLNGELTLAVTGNAVNSAKGTVVVYLAPAITPSNAASIVGTITASIAANQSVNVAQIAGVTAAAGTGVVGAGTQRVVIATDQAQLTNKLLVTPDSVALPANQSVNVAQIAGVAPLPTSAANLTTANVNGALVTERGARATLANTSSASAQATATIALSSGVTYVVDCVTFSAASAGAVTGIADNVSVLDATSGTPVWVYSVGVATAAGAGVQVVAPMSVCGLNIPITTSHALNIQFGVGVTNVVESVALIYYSVH